jgi:hypothetical protein
MANCHDLFQTFISAISITPGKKDRMKNSKKGLRSRIRKYFREHHPDYEPKFYVQGSDKMKTGIRTKDDICDLDDGVYFFRAPDVTATTLQGWVLDAVDGYTDTVPEHRNKCVRNIFAGDYEIDMPIYYKVDGREYQLAIKNQGWEASDPKAMVDWFNLKKDKNGQLVREVMDLKAWGDYKRNRMPNGLAMAILTANAKNNIVFNERDDLTLRDILKEIKRGLNIRFECTVPVTPYDNLFKEYDDTRKNNFLSALDEFIKDADRAIDEKNQLKASKLWQKHLGKRFPDGEDKDEMANRSESNLAALKKTAAVSNPWIGKP